MEFMWFTLIGVVAGWITRQVMKSDNFSVISDIIVGVIGALLAGFLFRELCVSAGGLLASLIIAAMIVTTIGIIVFLLLLRLFKKA